MMVLVGFMGAGKTTVGRLLARNLGYPFIDTDQLIENRTGMPIPVYFEAFGEPQFRELERDVVREVLGGPDAVIALGGGALGDPATLSALEWADVIYLEVGYSEARSRIGDGFDRPMLGVTDPRALYSERIATYEGVASFTIPTDELSPEEIVDQIVVRLSADELRSDGLQRIAVPLGERSYTVTVGRDLIGRFADFLPKMAHAEKAFVITHPDISELVLPLVPSLKDAGLAVDVVPVPEGENAKSVDVAKRLYDELGTFSAHRHDLIVGFGGGVACDLAGFVGSTYARGMRVAYVPTTLLAQVDAAIGGKTAVNLPHGKNLVGTIYQPISVVCDVDLLADLPQEELRSGLAEVVKYGFIADPDLIEFITANSDAIFERDPDVLIELIARSVAIKAAVVGTDERDVGERAVLNYGHTFGHAIEHLYGLRHGEAVALGMMAAAYLAAEVDRVGEDVVDLHRSVLESVGLPVTEDLDMEMLEEAWMRDKKYKDGVRFVLLADVGKPEVDIEVTRSAVVGAIGRLAT